VTSFIYSNPKSEVISAVPGVAQKYTIPITGKETYLILECIGQL